MNLKLLLNHLKEESSRGVSHVYLDTEARNVIKALVQKDRPKHQSPTSGKATALYTSPTPISSASQKVATHQPPKVETPLHIPKITLPDADKISQLRYLKDLCKSWPPAIALQNFKNTLVFAKGNPDAKIVLLGDAPGFYEERERHPFKGQSGQKLDQILKAMGLSRNEVYITNICKLRPSLPGQTTNNRKPTSQEMKAWLPILDQELEIVQPLCIIALGSTTAEGILALQNQLVGKLRGQWFDYKSIPVRVTYHPSYLLRNAHNNTEKRKLWEDMLTVMDRINLPVSNKQRAFFT